MTGLGMIALELALVALLLVLLNARASLLSRRVRMALDLSDCDPREVLPAVRGLADALPPGATLVVGTRLDAVLPVRLSVRSSGHRTVRRSRRSSCA
jgi:hypothetical protein